MVLPAYIVEGETEPHYVATATNITELPTQCKNGLVALVGNTIETTLDDTYRVLKDNFVDGPGVWAELRPGQPNHSIPSTMPHIIVRSPEVDQADPGLRTFWVGSGQWVPREVGDEDTASYVLPLLLSLVRTSVDQLITWSSIRAGLSSLQMKVLYYLDQLNHLTSGLKQQRHHLMVIGLT